MTLTLSNERGRALAEDDPLPPDDLAPVAIEPSVGAIYRKQRPRLLRFLAKKTSTHDADDLVQQSFVRVLSHQAARKTSISHPEAYLFQVACNVAADDFKAAGRQSRSAHLPIEEVELAGPDQLAGLEARDMLRRLEEVLLRLKPRSREIFLAHRIDGYSYGEIAARTGLSVKGVEKHMSRAIAFIDRGLKAR